MVMTETTLLFHCDRQPFLAFSPCWSIFLGRVPACWRASWSVPSSVILPPSVVALASGSSVASAWNPYHSCSLCVHGWEGWSLSPPLCRQACCMNLQSLAETSWMASYAGYPYAIVLIRSPSCLPFPAKRVTLTFSVAKLVQAASCKYQMPYSSDSFKNFLPTALLPVKTFPCPRVKQSGNSLHSMLSLPTLFAT